MLVTGALALTAVVSSEPSVAQPAPPVHSLPAAAPEEAPPTTASPTTLAPDPPTTTIPITAPEADIAVGRCATDMLSVSLTDQDAAAGSVYTHMDFTNVSLQPCTLQGYPEVAFLDDAGNQIGGPARRISGEEALVTVDPGSSAMATFIRRGAYVAPTEGCQPVDSSVVRVFPPDGTTALLMPVASRACANPETDRSGEIGTITVRTAPARPLPPTPPKTAIPEPPTITPPAADVELGPCSTSVLTAALTDTEGAAGTVYSHLTFTNTSAESCTLAGHPSVTFLDASRSQIGAVVPRVPGDARVVTLEPGSSAAAVFALHRAYVGTVAGCEPTQATELQVFPPNRSTYGFLIASSSRVCANPSTDGSASITVVTDTTVPAPMAPPIPALTAASILDIGGLGPVRVGMTPAEATDAAGIPVIALSDALGCSYAIAMGGPEGVGFMLANGRIVRVDVGPASPVKTLSGAGIGDTEAQLQSLYSDRLLVTPAKYIAGGHDLTLVPTAVADEAYRVIFETDGETVTAFRSGQLPQVGWVERCG